MGLQDIVTWYQKKIGTYDKQQWEKTIEQRILCGLTHIPMKTTKLKKTDYIDVDLVRGSSFPKAKPKHGFLTVTRLGVLRLLLLPLYAKWWVKQTGSVAVFVLLLFLYMLQLINTAVYCTYGTHATEKQHVLQSSEIVVPLVMMLILSIIHSQIVSTNPDVDPSKTGFRPKQRKVKSRRRKLHRHMRPDSCDSKTSQEFEYIYTKQSVAEHHRQLTDNDDNDENANVKHVKINTVMEVRESEEALVDVGDEEKVIPLKRNVMWDLSIPSSMPMNSVESSETEPYISANENSNLDKKDNVQPAFDDDGFESLNGNGSSENNSVEATKNGADKKTDDDRQDAEIIDDEIKLPNRINTVSGGKDKCEAWMESATNLLRRRRSAPARSFSNGDESDSTPEFRNRNSIQTNLILRRESLQERKSSFLALHRQTTTIESSGCDSEEGECESPEIHTSPGAGSSFCPLLTEATTSATEWMGVTTNSEDCTYSSEYDESDSHSEFTAATYQDQSAWDYDLATTVILNPSCAPSDKVSCTIWTHRDVKKADLSVLDISSSIIESVEAMPDTMDYFYGGIILSIFLACIPGLCRMGVNVLDAHAVNETQISITEFLVLLCNEPVNVLLDFTVGANTWERVVIVISTLQRIILGSLFFFLLAVAERTFKQRFLYAKLFLHLTSSRRARKSNLPHFRLNKVRNIKTWLSVRSYLKRRGPQRSVDCIVSAAFIITLLLLSFICIELLKDSVSLHSQYNLEVMFWSFSIGIYLLRFMTLGSKINRKYRNLSVLITEQINLYLQIEQKPHKKDELMVANSVLKLAADLLKELESPFKISGLSANPYLYTITKVIILSALSGVLSEMLGFKLKLLKIKFK